MKSKNINLILNSNALSLLFLRKIKNYYSKTYLCQMNFFNYFLFPFTWLYALITFIRNFCFDKGILSSKSYPLPIIAVGNLSVGGTGKTPMIEHLIRLLQKDYKLAVLSRGYKRQTKGYVLADAHANAQTIGDEPFQYFSKFKNISVAVSESRQIGIENLLQLKQTPQLILLDDAFQHRQVKAGFYILLSSFDKLYSDDYALPVGRLRESRGGARRANIIVVTKCPTDLNIAQQEKIKLKLNPTLKQQIFFSSIEYDKYVYNKSEKILFSSINQSKLIIVGIAKPDPFLKQVKNTGDEVLIFPDHHHFSEKDIDKIKTSSTDKIILTTEKDYMRLSPLMDNNLFYLPMTSIIINDNEDFNQLIKNYVRSDIRNS
jgi:tetraacyldisaccharide 4'-kinase